MKKILAALLALALLTTPALCASPAPDGEIRVAIIDTGISTRYLDGEHVAEGRNLVFPESDTSDRVGHGTEVAGILLGSAELGIAGVAPEAELVPLVWYDRYPSGVPKNGGAALIAEAIYAAVDEFGCRVINISAGLPEEDAALRSAVEHAENAGAVVVSAVGNDRLSGVDTALYPAAWNTVIGVGAADGDSIAEFSQSAGADVLAPGVGLKTVGRGAETVSGTSYACAYVSGVCARLLARQPELTPGQVRERIYSGAKDLLASGWDSDSGWGLISLETALLTDVPAGAWYARSALWAAETGLITGPSVSLFEPEAATQRAVMVAALWRMEGAPQTDFDPRFSDVPEGAWYAPAAAWAAETGLVSGVGDGRFAPSEPLKREQLAALLYRYCALKGLDVTASGSLSGFRDSGDVSDWAKDAMSWSVGAGLFRGDGGALLPNAAAARAQSAELLMRVSMF